MLLLLLLQERGDYLASTLETRYRTTRETRSLANPSQPEKHNLCLSISYSYTYHIYTTSQPKGTTSPQPILIDDNGTPATWTLVLFQQVIDRQDRTRAEGRFSFYWNHWRYTLNIQESLPLLPDKDSSHDDDDMPCWLHSIEATTDPAGHHLANRHLAGDRLRIASLRIVPGHPGGLHRSSRLPTTFLMTNHPH